MKYRLPVAVLSALMLASCASVGNTALKQENAETVAAKIVKGKTTQAEVRTMFGSPSSSDFTDSGNQIWRYSHSKATSMGRNFIPYANMFSSGQNIESKELVIFFDNAGVVQNYSMEESKLEAKQGILRQ